MRPSPWPSAWPGRGTVRRPGASLSSTAFALQVLEEKGELALRHGRLAFAILLFQDLAAIPLIALTPLFAVSARGSVPPMQLFAGLQAIGTIVVVVVAGRYLLDGIIRIIARTRVKEAMTACALLTVVGVTLVMEKAGLSVSLGAFIAGVLFADSDYRHEIEADIAPFEGLLLGLFFTAIGMSLNLGLIVERPHLVMAIVAGLLAVKSGVLYLLGRRAGLEAGPSRRLALAIAQGGEFAFVLFTAGLAAGVLEKPVADLLVVAVTLSMAATPLLLLVDEMLAPRAVVMRAFDALPENDGHVVIAGFGRVGQIVARILAAKRIPFTALDPDPEHVDAVRHFGRASSTAMPAGRSSWTRRRRPRPRLRAGDRQRRGLAADRADGAPALSAGADLRPRTPPPAHASADGLRDEDHSPRDFSLLARPDAARCCGVSASPSATCASRSTPSGRPPPAPLRGLQACTDLEKLQARARTYTEELKEQFAQDAAEQANRPASVRLRSWVTLGGARGRMTRHSPYQNRLRA